VGTWLASSSDRIPRADFLARNNFAGWTTSGQWALAFHQIFAEDAMSALSAEEHTTTVTKIFPRIGVVRKAKEILADLSPN